MKPQAGDILIWKDPNFSRKDYLLVLEVDKSKSEPYLLLNLTTGLRERLAGRGFKYSDYWELAA